MVSGRGRETTHRHINRGDERLALLRGYALMTSQARAQHWSGGGYSAFRAR